MTHYLRNALNSGRLQATAMGTITTLVVFDVIDWTDVQVAAVNGLIGLWILFSREVFEKELHDMARWDAEIERDNLATALGERVVAQRRAGIEVVSD
jgi:hypothetical protein